MESGGESKALVPADQRPLTGIAPLPRILRRHHPQQEHAHGLPVMRFFDWFEPLGKDFEADGRGSQARDAGGDPIRIVRLLRLVCSRPLDSARYKDQIGRARSASGNVCSNPA
jgi:hypothetical protein